MQLVEPKFAVMSAPLHPPELTEKLAAGYAALESADRALHEAEQQLQAAHLRFANHDGPSPDEIYREVVALRERSRRLLDELGALFFADSTAARLD